jgi:hypothetical protein
VSIVHDRPINETVLGFSRFKKRNFNPWEALFQSKNCARSPQRTTLTHFYIYIAVALALLQLVRCTAPPCASAFVLLNGVCVEDRACAAQYLVSSVSGSRTEAAVSLAPELLLRGDGSVQIVVQHAAVLGRVVTGISVDSSNAGACNYPQSPNWLKAVQSDWTTLPSGRAVCRDTYTARLPWPACRMLRADNASHVVFSGTATVAYTEPLGNLDGFDLGLREVSSVVRFSVVAPKTLTLTQTLEATSQLRPLSTTSAPAKTSLSQPSSVATATANRERPNDEGGNVDPSVIVPAVLVPTGVLCCACCLLLCLLIRRRKQQRDVIERNPLFQLPADAIAEAAASLSLAPTKRSRRPTEKRRSIERARRADGLPAKPRARSHTIGHGRRPRAFTDDDPEAVVDAVIAGTTRHADGLPAKPRARSHTIGHGRRPRAFTDDDPEAVVDAVIAGTTRQRSHSSGRRHRRSTRTHSHSQAPVEAGVRGRRRSITM